MTRAGPLSFVTVVYRAELGLLRIQARSLALYVLPDDVAEVVVVLNDRNPQDLAQQIKAFLEDWGPHVPKVRFVSPGDVFRGPTRLGDWPKWLQSKLKSIIRRVRGHPSTNWDGASGWLVQQALKLACARVVSGECIVFLDAKNHFIRAAKAANFFTEDGIAMARMEYTLGDGFEWHRNAHAFLDLPPPVPSQQLPPAITPYVAAKRDVLETLARIEQKAGAIEYFFKPKSTRGSEFTLLAATQLGRNALVPGLLPFDTLFRGASEEQVMAIIERAKTTDLRILGTHSGLLREMTRDQQTPLHVFWQSVGLVRDACEAGTLVPSKSDQ